MHLGSERCAFLGVLSKKEGEALVPEFPIFPIFHHLPKKHKGLDPLVGRLIVAEIGSLNENFGLWVDCQLHPLVKLLPSYLRDIKQLLNLCDKIECVEGDVWITCDVSSLYSSIPHAFGLRAVEYFLDTYSGYSPALKEYIIECLDYLLMHNFFCFDDSFCLQRCGHPWVPIYHPLLSTTTWVGGRSSFLEI